MDGRNRSIEAQVAAKCATEIVVAKIGAGQEVATDAWERAATMIDGWITAHAMADGRPFEEPQQTSAEMPPAAPSPQVAPPLPQPQPVTSQPQQVASGPPCPVCQTPTVMTKDYVAKKARNLSEGKKPPPLWRCPLGSYDPQTRQPAGCQGCLWEEAAA